MDVDEFRTDLSAEVRNAAVETMRFAVDKNFPRLTRDNLPSAIVEASYSLSLRGLKEVESNGR